MHFNFELTDLLAEIHGYDTPSSNKEVEGQIIFDSEHDHYLLIDVGWEQKKHVYGAIIHIDIKDEKIWIQKNNTEINLADRLLEANQRGMWSGAENKMLDRLQEISLTMEAEVEGTLIDESS